MFLKVYFVHCSNYNTRYHKKRFRLPPGEMEEYREHACAPMDPEATREVLPLYWEVEVSIFLFKVGT